jgi:hypothetical protein
MLHDAAYFFSEKASASSDSLDYFWGLAGAVAGARIVIRTGVRYTDAARSQRQHLPAIHKNAQSIVHFKQVSIVLSFKSLALEACVSLGTFCGLWLFWEDFFSHGKDPQRWWSLKCFFDWRSPASQCYMLCCINNLKLDQEHEVIREIRLTLFPPGHHCVGIVSTWELQGLLLPWKVSCLSPLSVIIFITPFLCIFLSLTLSPEHGAGTGWETLTSWDSPRPCPR